MKNHGYTLLALSLSTLTACAGDDASSFGKAGLAMQAATAPADAAAEAPSPEIALLDAAGSEDFSYERVVQRIAERVALVPRFSWRYIGLREVWRILVAALVANLLLLS